VITLVGLGGLALAVARRKVPQGAWPGLLLAAVWVGLLVVALYLWARVRYPQGRMLFPAAPALALLMGAGWVLPWPARAGRWATAGLAVGLATLSAWLLPAVILPAYAAPRPAAAGDRWLVGTSVPWAVGQGVGFDRVMLNVAPQSTLTSGQALEVTIPWRVRAQPDRDWSVYLHLVDDDGVVVAQRDSYPGGGSLPTSDWLPGMVVSDTHRMTIPFTAGSPACENCRLRIGWYDAGTGELPATVALPPTAEKAGEIQLTGFAVESAKDEAGRPMLPAPVHFGDDILLDGYDLHRRALDPGEKLAVTLYWRALRRPAHDYRVSVQLRAGDRIVAQSDAAPADDTLPTSGWQMGETVEDRHSFRVPKDVVPGDYTLEVLLFEPGGRPLPVDFRDFDYSLGPVRVTRPEG
jgi:hypothetical protein